MKLLRQEQGYAMLLVILTTVLISVISLGLLTMNVNSVKTSKHEEVDQAVFYIAEAGLNYEKEQINDLITDAYIETGIEHSNDKKNKISRNDEYYKSYYKNKIIDDIAKKYTSVENPTTIQPTVFESFKLQNSDKPSAEIIATVKERDSLTITIKSTGYFAEKYSNKRTVSQSIEVIMDLKFLRDGGDPPSESINLPNLAVQTKGDIFLKGSASIDGSVASSNGKVIFNGDEGVNITGIVGVSPENFIKGTNSSNGNNIVKENRVKSVEVTEYTLPEFPKGYFESLKNANYPTDFPLTGGKYAAGWNPPHSKENLSLTEDARLNNFSVPAGKKININIGDKTINLLVEDTFSIGSNATVNIIGNGKLNIYVKNSLTITGTLGTTNRDPNNINVYYAGTSTPKIDDGGSLIAASIYAEKSDLSLSGGGGISGNIISGGSNISIDGGRRPTGQYILAPNAHVQLGGDYKGVIIAQSYTGNKYGTVTYAPGIVPLPNIPEWNPDYSAPNLIQEKENLTEI